MIGQHQYYKYHFCGYSPFCVFIYFHLFFIFWNEFVETKILFQQKHNKWTESKTFSRCEIEKKINNFFRKCSECKFCYSKRSLKVHYHNKDKKSNQRKTYYGKIRYKLLQKHHNRYIIFKDLLRSYVELENRIKHWKNFSQWMTQKAIKIFIDGVFSKPLKKLYH